MFLTVQSNFDTLSFSAEFKEVEQGKQNKCLFSKFLYFGIKHKFHHTNKILS